MSLFLVLLFFFFGLTSLTSSLFLSQLDDLGVFLASDSESDDDIDDSGDEPRPNGVAKRKLTNKERLALLLQGDKSDEEQTDD